MNYLRLKYTSIYLLLIQLVLFGCSPESNTTTDPQPDPVSYRTFSYTIDLEGDSELAGFKVEGTAVNGRSIPAVETDDSGLAILKYKAGSDGSIVLTGKRVPDLADYSLASLAVSKQGYETIVIPKEQLEENSIIESPPPEASNDSPFTLAINAKLNGDSITDYIVVLRNQESNQVHVAYGEPQAVFADNNAVPKGIYDGWITQTEIIDPSSGVNLFEDFSTRTIPNAYFPTHTFQLQVSEDAVVEPEIGPYDQIVNYVFRARNPEFQAPIDCSFFILDEQENLIEEIDPSQTTIVTDQNGRSYTEAEFNLESGLKIKIAMGAPDHYVSIYKEETVQNVQREWDQIAYRSGIVQPIVQYLDLPPRPDLPGPDRPDLSGQDIPANILNHGKMIRPNVPLMLREEKAYVEGPNSELRKSQINTHNTLVGIPNATSYFENQFGDYGSGDSPYDTFNRNGFATWNVDPAIGTNVFISGTGTQVTTKVINEQEYIMSTNVFRTGTDEAQLQHEFRFRIGLTSLSQDELHMRVNGDPGNITNMLQSPISIPHQFVWVTQGKANVAQFETIQPNPWNSAHQVSVPYAHSLAEKFMDFPL